MLIFVYGDDTFRAREKVKAMKDRFIERYDPSRMNFDEFPALEKTKIVPGEVLQSISSPPFLGEKRMVVIHDLVGGAKADDVKVWEPLNSTQESTIVILHETMEPKQLEKKPLFKALKDASDVYFYPYPELSGRELEAWVATRAKQFGLTLDRNMLLEIVSRVGSDLWQMQHELEKLAAFSDGKPVTIEMINDLVRASFEGQIFALVDAVANRKPGLALRLLEEERFSGTNDFNIFGMLIRQVRILLGARAVLDENPQASKQDVAGEVGVHPFVAQKALVQARSFTAEDLAKTHKLLFKLDQGSKTGRHNSRLAVDLAVTSLLS